MTAVMEMSGPGTTMRRYSRDPGAVLLLLAALRESPVADIVSVRLYDDLELVLGERDRLSGTDLAPLIRRLDAALAQLVGVVPHCVHPYPDAALYRAQCLLGKPMPQEPNQVLSLVRRVALAVLELLDLMNDEPLPAPVQSGAMPDGELNDDCG